MSEDPNHSLIPVSPLSPLPGAVMDGNAVSASPQHGGEVWLQRGWAHRRLLLLCVGGGLLLGLAAQLLLPARYVSDALVHVPARGDQASETPLSGVAGSPTTYAKLLTTTPVFQAALETPELRELPSIVRLGDGALGHLQDWLRTSVSNGDEIITVTYASPSREDAPVVLKAVLDAYLAQLGADRGDVDEPSGVMDEQILADRLIELAGRQTQADVEVRLTATRLAQAADVGDDAQALVALMDADADEVAQFGVSELAYHKTERKKLLQQIEGMPSAWGPEHPVRGPVQRRADAMQHEIHTFNAEVVAAVRGELERSHATARRQAQALAAEIDRARMAAAQAARPPLEIRQWPEVPRRKSAPRMFWTLGLGALAGLGLGMVLMFRREQQSPAVDVMSPPEAYGPSVALLGADALEATTVAQGAPLLGQMPEVTRSLGVEPAGAVGPALDDPASSIHQIRAVLQVQAAGSGARAFVFTSPTRGAGKTSVALGVASSLALSGTRTLVVDCDLAGRMARHQAEHGGAGDAGPVAARLEQDGAGEAAPEAGHTPAGAEGGDLAATGGLPQGITGMLDGHALTDCVVESSTPGLSLLPAVNPQATHISKLSDAFVRRVIDESKLDYDLVVFDTGPVPGSMEALLVASQADGVVVVVRQGEDRKALNRTLSYLKVVGAAITGTVFNRVTSAAGPGAAAESSPADAGDAVAPLPPPLGAGPGAAAGSAAGGEALASAPTPEPVPDPADAAATRASDSTLLGSGILAAAVFSEADAGFASEDFELQEDGEFDDELTDIFGMIDDADGTEKGGDAKS